MITIDRRPMVLGSDPTKENRYREGGSINPRAVWIEHTIFYQGPIKTVTIKDTPVEVQGFLDLQRDFDSDGKTVYSICTFLHHGLRDPKTYKEYGSSSFGGDPIHSYRAALCMEKLPIIDDPWEDWRKAFFATQQVFGHFEDNELSTIAARRKVSVLIGEEQMAKILEAVPEDLEELITKMEEGYAWINVRNLFNDIKLGRIQPSEFYVDIMRRSKEQVLDLAEQIGKLEKSGGIW